MITIKAPSIGGEPPHSATGPTLLRALANWRKTWHYNLSSEGKFEPSRVIPFPTPAALAQYLGEVYGVCEIEVDVDGVTIAVPMPQPQYRNRDPM